MELLKPKGNPMSEHTGSPWRSEPEGRGFMISGVIEEGPRSGDILPNHPRARVIARCPGQDKEGRANAALIAEAPELLGVLERMLEVTEGCRCPNNGSGDCEWCQVASYARLVIRDAKAEGK